MAVAGAIWASSRGNAITVQRKARHSRDNKAVLNISSINSFQQALRIRRVAQMKNNYEAE